MFSSATVIAYFTAIITTAFGVNELFEAIEKGNGSAVMNILEPSFIKTILGMRVYDVDEINKRDIVIRLTPLECAMEYRKEDIAVILINKGANGRPLRQAIDYDMEKLVRLILQDARVDVNEEVTFLYGLKKERTTFLHKAVSRGNAAIVKMICDKGADLEKTNYLDFTPLQCAINYNDGVEIVRILLEAGADVNGTNSKLDTALHFAARHDIYLEIMNFFLSVEGVDIEAVNIYGYTPLITAADNDNVECMRALLAAGANAHASDDRLQTILHHPMSRGYEDIINLAKSYGFDFEYRDENGNTPFLYSAKYQYVNAMRALAKAGASVNVYNKEKKGVMHYAVQSYRHSAEMVEIALYYWANSDFHNEIEQPLDLRLLDRRGDMGRRARNKLLEAGLQLTTENMMELLKDCWPPCHRIVKNGNFRNFQELFGKANEACLKNGVLKMIENDDDLTNLLSEYELKGAFALFKILKTIYSKKEPATELERRKFYIFDYAVMEIIKSTYLATLPVELTSDILLCNTFYGWKLQSISFHLALAFEEFNVSLEEVKMAMADIISNY